MISTKNNVRHMKCLEEFTLLDDIFFFRCADGHPEFVAEILKLVLRESHIEVSNMELQKYIQPFERHGYILDCFIKTDDQRIMNVEIQQDSRGAVPKRARAYASALDVEQLEKGTDYQELVETILIFFTKHDKLKQGLPIYHVKRTIEETNTYFNDGLKIIYVNCSFKGRSPFDKLIHDMTCRDPKQMHYAFMKERAGYFKNNEGGKKQMCEALRKLERDNYLLGEMCGMEKGFEKGREEGREEGREKGREETKISIAKSLILTDVLSLEDIAKATGLSIEEVQKLKQTILK